MTVKLKVCTKIDGSDGKELAIDTNTNGAGLLEQAMNFLGLQGNFRALGLRKGTTLTWIDPKKNVVHYHLKEGTNLYILKIPEALVIQTTFGVKKKLFIDITQPVEKLVKFIADKLRVSSSGFTIYTLEDENNPKPMSWSLTLPQQSSNYSNLLYKRRYYVFLKSFLKDNAEALFIFKDVQKHVVQAKLPLTNEQAVGMAYYTIYAEADKPESITTSSVPNDLTQLFPPQITPTDADRQAIIDRISHSPEPLTREQAVIGYLSIAHEIPYFGCEIFRTKFATVEEAKSESKTARQDGTLAIGPKDITILLPSNEPHTVIPWFRFISYKEHKGSVDVKFMERKGSECELSLKVKKPGELATLIEGYASLNRTLGAQLMTDGFLAQEENATSSAIDPSIFDKYITPDNNMLYTYFPGSTDELEKVINRIDDIISYLPEEGNKLKADAEQLAKDPSDIRTRLQIVRTLNTLLENENHNDFLDENQVERALCTVTSINILPNTMQEIVDSLDFLIENQKTIRSETMTRLESNKKSQLQSNLKMLKEHRNRISEFIKSLEHCPTSGKIMLQMKKEILQIHSDIKGLTFFISQIISNSPDSSFLIAIDNFNKLLKSITTSIIPAIPNDQMQPVYAYHKLIFYGGVAFAIINQDLSDPQLSSNAELIEKFAVTTNDVFGTFSVANELRNKLNIRPFSLDIREQIVNQLNELNRAFTQIKPHTTMIADITGDDITVQAVSYVLTLINENIKYFSESKIHPYRRIPDKQQIQEICIHLADIKAKLEEAIQTQQLQPSVAEFITEKKNSITQIIDQLNMVTCDFMRSTLDIIGLIPIQLKDVSKHLNDLVKVLGNASIINSITSTNQEASKLLVRQRPSFQEFHKLLEQMYNRAKAVKTDKAIIELSSILSLTLNTSNFDSIQHYIDGMSEWTMKVASDLTPFKRELIGMIHQASDAIKQLPLAQYAQPSPLLIFPFFQGKDVFKMTTEFVQQITDINKFLTDFLKCEVFTNNEPLLQVIRHWANYFDSLNGQIEGLQQHESTLLSRLKEINRKAPQMKLFIRNIIPYTSEHKFTEMIDVFFQNCELIISKLQQPHISKNLAAKFNERISPLLSQTEIQLSRFIANNPQIPEEILEKVKALRQAISQRISDASSLDPSKQQDLADKLYSQLTEILPDIRQYPECAALTQQLSALRSQLSEYTALALGNKRGCATSSMFAASSVSESEVKEIYEAYQKDEIDTRLLTQLFRRLTAEPEMLAPPAEYAAMVLKNADVSTIQEEALRLLIFTQRSSENKREQIKDMAIRTSTKCASLVKEIQEYIQSMDVSTSNEKAKFYHGILLNTLNTFDPDILIQNQTFPSVSLTFSAIREIKSLMAMLLFEKPDSVLQEKLENYAKYVDEADISLKLYFYNHFETIIQDLQELSTFDEKAQELYTKVQVHSEALHSSTLLLEQDCVALSSVAQTYQQIESDIASLEISNNEQENAALNRLNAEVESLKEIKFIIKNWAVPMSDFDELLFRVNVLSHITIAQRAQAAVDLALKNNVMSMPFVSATPLSNMSAAVAYSKPFVSNVNGIEPIVQQLEADINEVNRCNVQLFSENLAYKADISLQKVVPAMDQRSNQLLRAVASMKEPNYSVIPKSLNSGPPRQLEVVSLSMENTEFFNATKEICDQVTAFYKDEYKQGDSESEEKLRLLTRLVEIIPTFTSLTLEQGVEELAKCTKQILDKPETLKEEYSKLVASLVRVLPSISGQTVDSLGISPAQILKDADSNQEVALSKIFLLDSYMNYMKNDAEELKNEATQSTVRIIEALDTEDPVEINRMIQLILALKCAIGDKNDQSPLLDGIIQNFETIREGVLKSVESNSKLDKDTAAQVYAIKREFIKMITGASMQLTEDIQKTTSIDGVLDVRTNNNLSARRLVGQCDPTNEKERKHLLFVASNMQILAHQGIAVTPTTPRTFIREFISLFDSSMATFYKLISSENTDSKKSLRMFRRVVDNMGDITDDISLELNSEPLSPFEQGIKDFLTIVSNIESMIANVNAGYSTAEIVQSFGLVLDEQKPLIEKQIEVLQEASQKLILQNTIDELLPDFKSQLESAQATLKEFLSVDQHVQLDKFISLEVKITAAFEQCAQLAIQMTDAVQLKYDPEAANKLPAKFKLPQLPSLPDDTKVKDCVSQLLESRTALDAEVSALRKLAQGLTCDHSELLSHTLAFCQCSTQFITNVFCVSITSTNLQNQSDLTSVATSLANAADLEVKSSRSLFLSIPTWNKEANHALDQVNEQVEHAVKLAQTALEIFEKEESSRDARAMLFIEALRPLQAAITKAEEALAAVQKSEDQMFRTMAANLINIAIAGGRVVVTTLLHAKDSEKSCPDPKKMIEASAKVVEAILLVTKLTNPQSVIDAAGPLAEAMSAFDITINPGPDTESMRTTIKQIISGSNALKETVTKTLTAKPKSKPAIPQKTPEEKAAAQAKLMKRLTLESKVHASRWWLEYSEKILATFE